MIRPRDMRVALRGAIFSFMLGLYRHWADHGPLIPPPGAHVRHQHVHPLDQPAQCFFWGLSSMAN